MFPLARCLPLLLICIAVQVAPLYSSPEPASQSPSSRPRPPGSGVALRPPTTPLWLRRVRRFERRSSQRTPPTPSPYLSPGCSPIPRKPGFMRSRGRRSTRSSDSAMRWLPSIARSGSHRSTGANCSTMVALCNLSTATRTRSKCSPQCSSHPKIGRASCRERV